MEIAVVTGTVVATRKDAKLEGEKLLLVRRADVSGSPVGEHYVALDSVDAGIGDVVLVVRGSSAREASSYAGRPVDSVITGIIDSIDLENTTTYKKA